MEALSREVADDGVVVVGLCDESPDVQKKVAEPAGVTYPLLVEREEMPEPFDGVRGFPAFLLLDRDGRILRPIGLPSVRYIRRALREAGAPITVD